MFVRVRQKVDYSAMHQNILEPLDRKVLVVVHCSSGFFAFRCVMAELNFIVQIFHFHRTYYYDSLHNAYADPISIQFAALSEEKTPYSTACLRRIEICR